ncbi:hypothetical protein DLJ49_08510 [Rhodovulum sp. 12E13]|uniref:hypothetical protein n=1 Tax=Rhodovulum sp. 12E13 TaxID=2203891 RepID=UPI000E14B6E1|nr:hypothetical protein [Rhodovulum sp. 12E13]RDC73143.1 hypothetical protein DLJ49_08510 [Rhodovulum sp. 12E13]
MIPRNTPDERDAAPSAGRAASAAAVNREALVAEMVRRAVLPRLLARKDDGAFDRGPNVVRFPAGDEV